MTDAIAAGPAVETAGAAVEAAKPWVERLGFGRLHHEGAKAAATAAWGDVKNIVATDVTMKQRRIGFARVGAVAAGAALAAGAFRSRDSEGNERNGFVRVGQAVLGTGIAAAGVLAGGR